MYQIDGTFYSDGKKINRNTYDKYFGWGEMINDVRVVEYIESEDSMTIYKNGSTPEKVYCDSFCTSSIGTLNPYEECACYGIFGNRAIVRYNIDGTDNFKIGFVKWLGGVK